MPIVDVELITDDALVTGLASRLADGIGQALRAEPGRTWVRVRHLPRHQYAESGGPVPDEIRPAFVTITARRHPDPDDFAEVAPKICRTVSAVTGCEVEQVHVIFEADARGRVAFGGHVVTEQSTRRSP